MSKFTRPPPRWRSWRTRDGLSHIVLMMNGVNPTTSCNFTMMQTIRVSSLVDLEPTTCLQCASWWDGGMMVRCFVNP